ncbi:GDSL-type esterase/lipase family protein [Flammeovirga kamogawensis]|uniref:SGNH/GDSL hydrolase family protein n=1 Tax=Flammeovirga kamogawensis TaxID=373891 RepID=A0ABX8GZB9_9BACT|nr:GDSL-type esterase/lipase family protein [Flammeovirga kamogawensis]MBB6459046.1 hypothetical protein [Flammeovirga kamogawensis]QWG08616.1 hypothetical protein KM029_06680 [Flammeovirga kamogawensis]TRX66909.1 hypothetical protein EO216_01725 [Flammeovirga kamogawensis]
MKLFDLIVLLLFFSRIVTAQTINIYPDNPHLQYTGRIEFSNPKVPTFSMPSSAIKVRFKGTAINAVLSSNNFDGNGKSYLYVIVDGKATPYNRTIIEVSGTKKSYEIATNLSDTFHTVELVKVSEYWSMVSFYGFDIPSNNTYALKAKPKRFIEFYGDSNPSGWSAWNDRDQGGDNESEGYFTYPGFVSRALNAEYVNFSAGGYGITPKMGERDLSRYYNKIHIKTDNPSTNYWDFENNYINKEPDVVVINLGANDFYNGATKAEQIESWKRFVTYLLRTHYQNTHIVLANSEGWAIGEPTDYIKEMIKDFQLNGEHNISYVKFPWLWGPDHAVISEQAGFADILAAHIAKVKGWDKPKPNQYSCFPKEGELLGNTSFESSILKIRPDGWRPISSAEAKTIVNTSNAKEGKAYVECEENGGIHQAVKAQKGDKYLISVWVKGTKGTGILGYEFRNQAQQVITKHNKVCTVTSNWTKVQFLSEEAPLGTWQINVVLKAGVNNKVKFDAVAMEAISVTSNSTKNKDLGK